MPFEPEKITREHILSAVQKLKNEKIVLKPIKSHEVIINGQPFPPKKLIRYAHAEMNGEAIWEIPGGPRTHAYFSKFGFEVVRKKPKSDPVEPLIEKYKQIVRQHHFEGETYKWILINKHKGHPDINAEDFGAEIKAMQYKNLVYQMSQAVLNQLAKERPEGLRVCFKNLFDETQDLTHRIKQFSENTLSLYREFEKALGHHQDERAIATYLTFYDPERYALFKTSFYGKYCDLINVEKKKPKEKYAHYLELLDELIENYIADDEELISLKKQYLPPEAYADGNHKLQAQDILYQTLDREEKRQEKNSRRYWRIGTSDSEGNYWHVMKNNSHVSIGWPDLPDLTEENIESKNDIAELLKKAGYYIDEKQVLSRKAGEIYNFISAIKPGDIVLAQDGRKVLGIGEVQDEEYGYLPEHRLPHFRNVDWRIIEPEDFLSPEGNQTTVFEIQDQNTIDRINNLLKAAPETPSTISENISTARNIILYGPPGTGKTYTTIEMAVDLASGRKFENHGATKMAFDELRKAGRIEFITFHQNYSYEDFMVGIKPDVENSHLRFTKYHGIFYQLCKSARDNYEQDRENYLSYVLIIDEINRANISRVFGELITLLEEDKRLGGENELRVTLPNGEKDFAIPPNLYVLGTMNTADKSIAFVDIALRRRFEFRGFYPSSQVIDRLVRQDHLHPDAAALLKALNRNIRDKKGADFLVGHAYFISKRKEEEIRNTLHNKVIPLLMEYFSNKTELVSEVFNGTGYNINYSKEDFKWISNRVSDVV